MALNKKQKDLLEKNAGILDSAPSKLLDSAKSVESTLLASGVTALDGLEFVGGSAVISNQNIVAIDGIVNSILETLRTSQYEADLAVYLNMFDVNAQITLDFLKESFDNVVLDDVTKNLLIANKTQSADILIGSGVDGVGQAIKTQLNNALSQGATKEEMIQILTDMLVSNEQRLALVTRFVSQHSLDRMAFGDRSFTLAMNETIGSVWWFYFGGTSKDSRVFCSERNGKFWHTNEISVWGDGKKSPGFTFKAPVNGTWQGRIPTTNAGNIFVNLGGFNCQHSLMPVSVFDVDKKTLQRNINSGNYEPTNKEKSLLGL